MGHSGYLSVSTALGLDFAVLTNPPQFPAMVIFPQFVYCDSISACNRVFSFYSILDVQDFLLSPQLRQLQQVQHLHSSEPRFSTASMPIQTSHYSEAFPSLFFFFLFPIQCCMFKSLEASDLSRCYRASWFSIHTVSFLTALNSSLSLCKKKKIFNTHGQG